MISKERTARLIVGLLIACTLSVAEAVPAWLDKEYGYFARDESLRGLFYDFAASVSVPAIISPEIKTVISGNFPAVRAKDFLAETTRSYNLSWIYDGTTLYVYSATEIEQKVIDLPYALAGKFQAYMEEVDIQGTPLNWKLIPTQNVLQVSGPPRFVALIGEAVERLRAQAVKRTVVKTKNYTVRVFHIEYSYVSKAGSDIAKGKAPVVTLAEMLGNIMNVPHISSVVGSGVGPGTDKLLGTGLVGADASAEQPAATVHPSQLAGARGNEAYIIGDPRLNAIVVRDLESRMPIYEQLIRELDKPLDQIEIEVSIVDIDVSAMRELGFKWVRNTNEELSFVFNTMLTPSELTGFVLDISALESKGKSRIVSRPSVLTLDNHEALFQNNQTFYVRLGSPDDGSQGAAVDLVPVSYGSVLRVRPHVIYETDGRKIQLIIHVEDGRRLATTAAVDGLPTVSQNLIQTQAMIQEGQSLLIGGYNIRERVLREERIPLLGYVPIVGFFFKRTNESDVAVARYFVITPRIIDTSINFRITTGFEGEDDGTSKVITEEVVARPAVSRPYPGPP